MQQRFSKVLFAATLMMVSAFSLTALADGMDSDQKIIARHVAAIAPSLSKTVRLNIGKAETVGLPKSAADVLVANPQIADVGSLRANRLYIVGKMVGDTNVLAFDDQGNQMADITVHVSVDEANLRDSLREFFPNEAIEAHTVNDSVILKGSVSNPSVANQVRDLAGRFIKTSGQTLVDLMTVRGEQQVMLKVKVIEARRDILREYGINTSVTGRAGDVSGAFVSNPGVGLTALTPFGAGAVGVFSGAASNPVNINVEGLERDGLINTLAEPTLTAISGETAGFLAGGEFPVPSGRDTSGNVSIEFKQFGVSLNFIPTVLDEGRISMQLTSEVSEKSDQDSVTLVNTIIPGLTVRRAQTTVQMASGGTLMMAGLLKSRTVDAVNGFPGLKDLPILGDLFKSKSFQRGESELVFLVTPYIVEPYASPQAQRVATDEHAAPRAIMPMSADVPPQMPISAPAASTANPPSAPQTRFNNLNGSSSPARPQYQRQGQEERTAGSRKADATPVAALPKVAAVDTPTVEAAPVTEVVAAPIAPKPAKFASKKTAEVASEAAIAEKRKGSSRSAAEELTAKSAAATPVNDNASLTAADLQPVPAARDTLAKADAEAGAAAAPAARKSADPLATSFSSGLQKVYGNRAPAMGSGAGYGYIVD